MAAAIIIVSRMVLLWQARHPLELQHQPQRGHCIIDVVTSRGLIQPIGERPSPLVDENPQPRSDDPS